MTKVGEGGGSPKPKPDHTQDLEKNINKFKGYLKSYDEAHQQKEIASLLKSVSKNTNRLSKIKAEFAKEYSEFLKQRNYSDVEREALTKACSWGYGCHHRSRTGPFCGKPPDLKTLVKFQFRYWFPGRGYPLFIYMINTIINIIRIN